MEPERQIEKLLRAFARKRRAEPDDAFKLRPAVRRRLQAEVDRHFAEPEEEESVSLWQLLRRQWAFVLVFVLALFLGASLFMPALGKAKNRSLNMAAANNLRQIGNAAQVAAAENNGRLPATLDGLTNGYLTRETLTDPRSGQPFTFVAGGARLDALPTNAVLAYAPGSGRGRAVLLADGSVQMMNDKQFAEAASKMELARNEPSPIATATPATSGLFAEEKKSLESPTAAKTDSLAMDLKPAASPTLAANNGVSQHFSQVSGRNLEKPQVLESFEVRQNGSNIVFVDRDGSIYDGTVGFATVGGAAKSLAEAPSTENTGQLQGQAIQNSFFRVSGQNRSSKQSVTFTGSLIPLTNISQNNRSDRQAATGNGVAQAKNDISSSRITGTLTLDETNYTEIEALPSPP